MHRALPNRRHGAVAPTSTNDRLVHDRTWTYLVACRELGRTCGKVRQDLKRIGVSQPAAPRLGHGRLHITEARPSGESTMTE